MPWGQGSGEYHHNLLEENQEVTSLRLFVVEVILNDIWEKILVLDLPGMSLMKTVFPGMERSWEMGYGGHWAALDPVGGQK